MAVFVPRAGVAGGNGAVAHFNDAVEAAEVGGVVGGHHDGKDRTCFKEDPVDDLTARLVEGRVGFVEKENLGALDDGAGDERALQLAARQRVDRAIGEFGQVEALERSVNGFVAVPTFFEPSVMGIGAHLDQATEFEGEEFGEVRALGKVGDTTATEAWRFAGDQYFAGADRGEAGEYPEQGGFAGAIGADECRPADAGNLEARIMEGDWSVKTGGGGELLGGYGDAGAAVLLLLGVGNGGQD